VAISISLQHKALFRGPSPLSSRPLLLLGVCVRGMTDPGEAQVLCAKLQGLFPDHAPAPASPSAAGTAEHLSHAAAYWALAFLNSKQGLVRDCGARAGTDSDSAELWIGYHTAKLSMNAVVLAFELLCRLANDTSGSPLDEAFVQRMKSLQLACQQEHPDHLSKVLILGAESLGLPWARDPQGDRCWRYGNGSGSLSCVENFSEHASLMSHRTAADKHRTNLMLRRLGLPCTDQHVVGSLEEAVAVAKRLGWPVVVKPSDRGQGNGVTADIRDGEELRRAYLEARSKVRDGFVIVERHAPGEDHRLLVVRGKLVSVARRRATSLRGDGRRSIRQLVEALNRERNADPALHEFVKPIRFDEHTLAHLALAGLSPESILEEGREQTLRSNANFSTGGTSCELISETHPDVRALAETIAANLHLECIGLDYLSTDISRSWHETGGVIVEINDAPGVDVHVGSGYRPAQLGRLLLQGRASRVPSLLIVGGRETLARLETDWLPRLDGEPGTGYASPTGTRLGSSPLLLGAASAQEKTESLASNRACRRLVTALTPEQLMEAGMPFDRCERVLVCEGTVLPSEWTAVLEAHADRVESLQPPFTLPG